MLAPSLYSFKSLVSRVVIRYRVMGGTKEHLLAPALFLREIDRQLLSDSCPAAECAASAGQPDIIYSSLTKIQKIHETRPGDQ